MAASGAEMVRARRVVSRARLWYCNLWACKFETRLLHAAVPALPCDSEAATRTASWRREKLPALAAGFSLHGAFGGGDAAFCFARHAFGLLCGFGARALEGAAGGSGCGGHFAANRRRGAPGYAFHLCGHGAQGRPHGARDVAKNAVILFAGHELSCVSNQISNLSMKMHEPGRFARRATLPAQRPESG